MRQFIAILLVILLASCGNQPAEQEEVTDPKESFVPARPNTIMAEDSVKVPESPNNFAFRVKVMANEYTKQGTYTIAMIYGPDSNASMFTMPKGAAYVLPEIKKKDGYEFVIGFTYQGKFYDYYKVAFTYGFPHRTKVSMIQAYVLE